MYDPKFSIKQMYDQYGSSKSSTSSKATTAGPRGYTRKSTPAPTPKQRTDRGYIPTNIAAPKSTSRSDRTAPPRSADYFSKGLGSRDRVYKPETEELSTWEKVKSAFTNTMETFGIFDEPDTTTTPDAVYKDGNLFSPEPYMPDTSRFEGDTQLKDMTPAILKDYGSIYKREGDISPTLPTGTDNPILNVFGVERGFTRSPAGPQEAPTMEQPEMPDTFRDSIQKAVASALVPRRDTKEYTIKAGDTLSEIAEREGTTVKALADMNDIPESDVDMIRAGETLKIPAKSLTDTQAALRRGFDKPKDTEGVETAGLGDFIRSLVFGDEETKSLPEKTFAMLKGAEKYEEKPYSLNNKVTYGGEPHKSGLSIGAGIDFGQHTEQKLVDMGIPKSMVKKAKDKGWIGLNPDTIIDPLTKKPAASRERGHELMYEKFKQQEKDGTLPNFTEEEIRQATPVVYKPYEEAAKQQYENDTGKSFDDLSEGTKSVLSLEKYHRGVNYELPPDMIMNASIDNPIETAKGIANKNRRDNIVYLLKINKLNKGKGIQSSTLPKVRPKGLGAK